MKKSFKFNESKIVYTIVGSGSKVVLVHGFGEDSGIWDRQVQFLQNHFQLIIPDLPGSGESALLPGNTIGVETYADCLYALLQNEKAESIVMLGHSMGGYITLAFAENYREKLNGFGFIHSTAFADSNDKKQSRLQGIRMIEEHGAYSFLKNTTPNLFSKKFKAEDGQQVSALIEKSKQFSNEALIQYYNAMMNRPDRTAVLKSSNLPVLFVIGEEDVAAPLQDLLQQVHLPKTAHIHILENVGHVSMMEEPGQLNNFILDFVNNI